MIWARVQSLLGPKWVSSTPAVMTGYRLMAHITGRKK